MRAILASHGIIADMLRKLTVALLVAITGASLTSSDRPATTTHLRSAPAVITHAAKPRLACSRPAPATAKGYAAMFAALPVAQWGAGDVSLSVPLRGGADVWLYGDTFSAGRFVHSTAIVQRGGCLHVSHAGAQLLPNDDERHIYWIDSAMAHDHGLLINARAITLTGLGAWDFHDGGHTRTAYATVSSAGDVTFVRWTADRRGQAPDAGPMLHLDNRPHHFGYGRRAHPEVRLADGRILVTTCQNYDDGILHPFADYRPIFSEQ